MMLVLPLAVLVLAPIFSLLFSTLTYALRDLSRSRLADALGKRDRDDYFEPTLNHAGELAFITGSARLLANMAVLLAFIDLLRESDYPSYLEYTLAMAASVLVLVFMSLALPHAIASEYGESWIARFVRSLHAARRVLQPGLKLLHLTDSLVRCTNKKSPAQHSDAADIRVEEEILEAIEEGSSKGVVDEHEKELIERVIGFDETIADEAMTSRKKMVALPIDATLDHVRHVIERSGHSRIPVYEGSLDKVVGVLYARDLLKQWARPSERFDLRTMLRQPLYVPREKPLRELLQDFRLQKVHIAIVVDEYNQTAGLLTIEDILEQLVGDISDEHEPLSPAMFTRIDDHAATVDASLDIDELNRLMGILLPEDDERFETVGGFVTTMMEKIPVAGESLESHGVRFSVLESEAKRVVRLRLEVLAKE